MFSDYWRTKVKENRLGMSISNKLMLASIITLGIGYGINKYEATTYELEQATKTEQQQETRKGDLGGLLMTLGSFVLGSSGFIYMGFVGPYLDAKKELATSLNLDKNEDHSFKELMSMCNYQIQQKENRKSTRQIFEYSHD